jgi:phosphoribosylformimino-5-aminoimidazole carboxamide ribotide isomerase
LAALTLYPAIDLKDGACVRLRRGAMDQATLYNPDPADQARRFAGLGFAWLHVVDLNGAFAGRPVNGDAVRAILAATPGLAVQVGGGIRDLATIGHWLGLGVRRVILGTAAVRNPALVREACRNFPGRIVVGIDAREGRVAAEGWAETTEITALDLALRFEDAGVAAIVHTDIDRDGMLGGPNIDATADLAGHLTTPVIASGGVSSLADIVALKQVADRGIEGAILGRALYDGRIDPIAALELAAGA